MDAIPASLWFHCLPVSRIPGGPLTALLYCFGESGNSYKAALTMNLSGYEWTPRFVDFFGGETRTEEFRRLNVMGEAPVLVDGRTVLSQSGAIQYHVAGKTGMLDGTTSTDRAEVLRWILWDNHKMSSICGIARFLDNFVPEPERFHDIVKWHQGRLQVSLRVLETALDGCSWLVGDTVTLADLACCSYLYYPEPFGFVRSDWPNIDSWLDRLANLPGWAHPYDLMPGNPSERYADK